MKPSRRFLVLMFIVVMLILAIFTPSVKSVQAAHPSQSTEERIKATMEDANQALGGGFKWTSESPGSYVMDRPPIKIGNMPAGDPVFLHERMIIGFGDGFDTCEGFNYYTSSTFHGMQACLDRKPHYLNQGYLIGLSWQPQDGLEFNGAHLYFYVSSGLDPTCAGYDAETEASCGDWSKSTKPLILAEALHQAALKNGLYESLPDDNQAPIAPVIPAVPGEISSDQGGIPSDASGEYGGFFGIPYSILWGSFGIPLAGAFSGAAVSALWAAFASKEIPSEVTDAATKAADYAQTMAQLAKLHAQLQQIDQELLAKNIYVRNPYQGDPTLIADGLAKLGTWTWDNTAGWVTKSQGLTCEGYKEATFTRVQSLVHQQFPGAKLRNIKFEEKSTLDPAKGWLNPDSYLDWLDAWNDDDHDLAQLELPDKSLWSIDFQQHNLGKRPPILRPWKDAQKVWEDYLGGEFKSRVSVDDEP
ncbi:MAG: hypothetical protein AB9891_03090 [Anaerolineaceae bacterium]